VEVREEEETEAETTFGKEAIEGHGFSIHFDVDPQELNQLFQDGFFNLVGQGVLQPHPRPDRPPFQPHQSLSMSMSLPMCLYNQKCPSMMGGKK
jgi:hypothetical protein